MGGCLGFSRGMAVKCTRAELARAENSTLYAASRVRNAMSSSSRLLVDFVHPGPQEALPQLLLDMS